MTPSLANDEDATSTSSGNETRAEVGLEQLTHSEVKQRVLAAYNELLSRDSDLLTVDANERSITHKLAEYLQRRFSDWNVDCEYNRARGLPKRIESGRRDASIRDTDARTAFPDIIIHKRGTEENLVVIEAKKSTTVSGSDDRVKLHAYLADHRYRHAFEILFPVGGVAGDAHADRDVREVFHEPN